MEAVAIWSKDVAFEFRSIRGTKIARSLIKAAHQHQAERVERRAAKALAKYFNKSVRSMTAKLFAEDIVPMPEFAKYQARWLMQSAYDQDKQTDMLVESAAPQVAKAYLEGAAAEKRLANAARRRRGLGAKATTATEAAQRAEEEIDFPTEMPEWLEEAALDFISHTFEEDYWLRIPETTRDDIEYTLEQGIENGLSIREIAQRIRADHGSRYSKARATMVARTEITGAMNAGHQEGIRQAYEGTGMEPAKEWLSVMGTTTRETHADADGQQVPVDEDFIIGGYPAAYPGDARLPPQERCNCQCAIISAFVGEGLDDSEDIRSITCQPAWLKSYMLKYDPSQPRDESGRWSSGGGGGPMLEPDDGGGGGAGGASPTAVAEPPAAESRESRAGAMQREILDKAKAIQFSDAGYSGGPVYRVEMEDHAAIRESMTPGEQETMRQTVESQRPTQYKVDIHDYEGIHALMSPDERDSLQHYIETHRPVPSSVESDDYAGIEAALDSDEQDELQEFIDDHREYTTSVRDDLDQIESRMTSREQDRMAEQMFEHASEYASSNMGEFEWEDRDDAEIANDAGYSHSDIEYDVGEIVRGNPQLEEIVDLWVPRDLQGEDAIDHLLAQFEPHVGDMPVEMQQSLNDYANRAKEELESATESAETDARESWEESERQSLEEDYFQSDQNMRDRREYLENFYDENKDRYFEDEEIDEDNDQKHRERWLDDFYRDHPDRFKAEDEGSPPDTSRDMELRGEYLRDFYHNNPDRFIDRDAPPDTSQDSELERRYLENFWRNNKERYQEEQEEQKPTWYKPTSSKQRFDFQTSSGRTFQITAYQTTKDGHAVTDISFNDDQGDYGISGRGEAFEIFGNVVPAVTAYVNHEDPPAVTFSAATGHGGSENRSAEAGNSRQKLYDTLVKTMLSVDDKRFGIAYDAGYGRQYIVAKNELKEQIVSRFGDQQFTELKPRRRRSVKADERYWEFIEPELDPDAWTEEFWADFDEPEESEPAPKPHYDPPE